MAPCVRRGHTLQAQLLCAGEFKVAVEIYPDGDLADETDGCPAAIVFPNPTPALVGGNYGSTSMRRTPMRRRCSSILSCRRRARKFLPPPAESPTKRDEVDLRRTLQY